MRIHKYLRSEIFYLLIFGLLISIAIPNVAKAGKYKVKTWVYDGFLDCDMLGFLPGGAGGALFRLVPLAIGFAPLHGFGIGTAVGETAFPSKENKMLAIGTWFPAYLYWFPFANWNRGSPDLLEQLSAKLYNYLYHSRSTSSHFLAQPIIYTFFDFSNWAGVNFDSRYFRGGIGISSSLLSLFTLGFEAGFISYNNDTTVNSLYIGANVWWGGWEAF